MTEVQEASLRALSRDPDLKRLDRSTGGLSSTALGAYEAPTTRYFTNLDPDRRAWRTRRSVGQMGKRPQYAFLDNTRGQYAQGRQVAIPRYDEGGVALAYWDHEAQDR